ncbi:unnamed protein product [Mytilus coruscus]|uniref:Uncharacterized protein n=1 Tax=Mytilus coruscus TaxID=42192 RepID=A0A6J8EZE2_MYTCO|nr:unnamed protein product [Mytilus coruscus]
MNKSVIKRLSDNANASDVISAILDADHVNRNELSLCRQWAFIFESSCKFGSNLRSFATGSRIECSVSPKSDEDQMLQMRDTQVISNADDATMAGNKFIMDISNSPPGYTLLRLFKISSNMNMHETKGCRQSCVLLENKIYLSSEKYLHYNMGLIANINKFCPPSFQAEFLRNGPCVRLNYRKHGKDSDIAIGLECTSWPRESLEWVTRIRKSNWPNQLLVKKIKQMPCHVLPIGHPESDKCDLEWRFAYILPEQELMWNLNDVQIQCYVIFKTLTKEWLDPIAPDEISSFHLKTILFWLSEEIVDWTPEQLIDNVKKCFDHLYKAIAEVHLSHYFFRSRNLFSGKLHNGETRAKLLSKCLQLQKNVIPFFLQSNWQYRRGGKLLSTVRLVTDNKLSEKQFWTICIEFFQQYKDKCKRNDHSHAKGFSLEVALTVMYLRCNKEILMKVAEEIKKELGETLIAIYTDKFLSLRLGMIYLAEANNTADKEKRQNFAEAKRFFDTGQEHDALAACMYLLTYHYQTGNYITIKNYLKELFGKRSAIIYKGTPGFNDPGNRVSISPDMCEGFSETDIANENNIAFDVLFSCSDKLCVPPAIQQECDLLDGQLNWSFCAIHPLVYASYVQFQVAANLGDLDEVIMSINHLRKMVIYIERRQGDISVNNHRHYNILGYCYYINKDIPNAMQWFNKSLLKCPTRGNAAFKYVSRYST